MLFSRSCLAACLLIAATAPLPVFAADTGVVPATLVVIGHSDIERAPDLAVIRAEIATSNASADVSRKKNEDITAQVVQAISALGLPTRALRTTNYRSAYVPREKDAPSDALIGFVVTREIEITTDPTTIEAVMHALQTNGVSNIDGISTSISQRKNAYQETLAAAMNDAQTQAQVITHAAHERIVRIVTIDASQAPVFSPRMGGTRSLSVAASAPAAADVELSATVTVTYEIVSER